MTDTEPARESDILREARAVVDAFWNSCGETTIEEGIHVLFAAYELGDIEEFNTVLHEVISTNNADITWDMLTAFKQMQRDLDSRKPKRP